MYHATDLVRYFIVFNFLKRQRRRVNLFEVVCERHCSAAPRFPTRRRTISLKWWPWSLRIMEGRTWKQAGKAQFNAWWSSFLFECWTLFVTCRYSVSSLKWQTLISPDLFVTFFLVTYLPIHYIYRRDWLNFFFIESLANEKTQHLRFWSGERWR